MEPALVCSAVSKKFKEDAGGRKPGEKWWRGLRPKKKILYAVREVSFEVPRGQIFGILGPNGSGKSTLIRIISTLLIPDNGRVFIFGHDVMEKRLLVRRMINRVSVEAAFFKKLSSYENLIYAARLYDLNAAQARNRSREILERLGFPEKKIYTPMENLSRGLQQKVAVARALLTSPVLLLLDEPTTGLDPKSKRDVQNFILEVQREHDTTIILTTHDMEEAEKLCRRLAIIEDGGFVALDTPANLKDSLASQNGGEATLEDVFFALTGKGWEEAQKDAD
jgi:ABC-2 type transport system ATP-binding protein